MNFKISIIICNTLKSLEYLKVFKNLSKEIDSIIYLDNKKNFSISKKIKKLFHLIKFKRKKTFYTNYISETVGKYILNLKEKNIIFSNYEGKIVKNKKVLKNKNLIHFHSGKLPNYAGSTTIFYSLLNENKIFCDCLILNEKIDGGKILFQKTYLNKNNNKVLSNKYDAEIRADVLKYILKNFIKLKIKKQIAKKRRVYYIAHPIIRTLALKKARKISS